LARLFTNGEAENFFDTFVKRFSYGTRTAMNLNEILDGVIQKQSVVEELELQLKSASAQCRQLENLAAEALRASGLDRVTYAGRTWRVEMSSHLSVPKDNRDAVMEAAKREGIAEELTTINTSTLKSWLVERRRENGNDATARLAHGTAFDGLVSEFSEARLRSRASS